MPEIIAARAIKIDPSSFFREGLDSCLSKGGHVAVLHASSPEEVWPQADTLHPDLALVGPNLAEDQSLALCRAMISRWPALKIILFSPHADDLLFQADAASAGANACLAAITAVLAGHQLFSRGVLSQPFRPEELTAREREVLNLLAGEKTDREIAEMLGLSVNTVHNHSQRILEKLGVHERREAVRRARRRGWV